MAQHPQHANLPALFNRPYKIYRSPEGQWVGCVEVRPGVKLCAYVDENLIKQSLLRAHVMLHKAMERFGVPHEGAASGFLGLPNLAHLAKHIGKIASDVAHGHVKAALREGKKMGTDVLADELGEISPFGKQAAHAIMQHPLQAATLIPGIGPIAAPAIQAGASLLSRVRRGDPQARQTLQAVNSLATGGNPQAAKLQQLLAGILQQMSGGAVAGDPGRITAHGRWVHAHDGSRVFVPHAFAGGAIWDQLRPHIGYRAPGEAFSSRTAYKQGLGALASMH
jgi:hypothetical protein